MSAQPSVFSSFPDSASFDAQEARLELMRVDALAEVMRIENTAYDWPWLEANIADSIRSGYQCVSLVGGKAGKESTLLGYYIAMQGVDEVHLLNITVAPQFQGQGWARVMLDALSQWARGQQVRSLWLEVRVGNTRALQVYESYGFRRAGQRKAYYPNGTQAREDAIVMSLPL